MQKTLDDLPEELVLRMMDYAVGAGSLTNGRDDFRIPFLVVHDWALKGHCVLSTNDLARRFGTTRRTICKAIKRLIDADAIREVGRTVDGLKILVPCLERGDEWRTAREARANGEA